MNANTLIAAITAAGSILVAITALLLNYRGFQAIDARFASVERRLELIETDLREFFRVQSMHATDIARLKDKVGLN